MKRSDRLATYTAVVLATGGGLLYGWALYFGATEDEFGPVQHPWVPTLQSLHVLTVPVFVFALGLIWHSHILARLRGRARRRTGVLLLAQAIPMVVSGYALQVAVAAAWREAWLWAHLVTSGLFCVAFVAHLVAGLRPARA